MLGDPTAKEARRLSLNPLRHVDPVGTVLLPGAMALVGGPVFGWAKPVPVNKWRLNNPRFGMMAVAAAGPASNFVMAAMAAIVLGLLARGLDPASVSVAMQWTITGTGLFHSHQYLSRLFQPAADPAFRRLAHRRGAAAAPRRARL